MQQRTRNQQRTRARIIRESTRHLPVTALYWLDDMYPQTKEYAMVTQVRCDVVEQPLVELCRFIDLLLRYKMDGYFVTLHMDKQLTTFYFH
jgi:hypothetical protein